MFPPIVMGEGRLAWDAAYEKAHTWGGKVTITHKAKAQTMPSSAPAQHPKQPERQAPPTAPKESPLAALCGNCGRPFAQGDTLVPLRGVGARTIWGHKTCASGPARL